MSQQAIDTTAVVTERQRDGTDRKRPLHGEVIFGIRVDELPKSEADRLAADGKFYPLTTDKDGQLRVTLPDGVKVETKELAVLREIRDLLEVQRDCLLKLAPGG